MLSFPPAAPLSMLSPKPVWANLSLLLAASISAFHAEILERTTIITPIKTMIAASPPKLMAMTVANGKGADEEDPAPDPEFEPDDELELELGSKSEFRLRSEDASLVSESPRVVRKGMKWRRGAKEQNAHPFVPFTLFSTTFHLFTLVAYSNY
jgi:hypothetical protein